MPECALVLRTLNEATGLRELLPVLRAQEPEPPRVIAVDSGSTDDTLRILADAGIQTIRITPQQFTYGRAINLGLAQVTEPFGLLLSAHAIPRSRYWAADLIAPMKRDPHIAAVSGAINGEIPYCRDRRQDLVLTSPEQYLADPLVGLVNANAAVRISAWKQLPFDDLLGACEDRDWTYRALKAGFHICLSTGGDACHHHDTDSPRQLYDRGHREHVAMYEFFSGRSWPAFAADIALRPCVWFARGFRRWLGYVAWRYGQMRGRAAGRRTTNRVHR